MPKLLLVEDNAHIQRIFAEKFRREGFDVTTAADGETAVSTAQQARPDAVLLDIMLPGMNGFDVLRQFQGDPALQAVPVFMLSNRSWPDDVQLALSLGARRFYSKGSAALADIVHEIRTACGFRKLLLFTSTHAEAQTLIPRLAHPRLLTAEQTVLAELRAAVERGRPDVVLLDGRTPTAAVALQQLRTTPALAGQAIVVISDQSHAFQLADEVIPVSQIGDQLRTRVHRRLGLDG